jgi:alkylation response protein AidB-like acyl-CoA dehydrogenase
MDFDPTELQRQIVEATEQLLKRHAGFNRARAQVEAQSYDHELHRHLAESGYLSLIAAGAMPLDAALVVEAVARHAGTMAAGATALTYPVVMGETAPGPVAIGIARAGGLIRLGAFADRVLLVDGDKALLLEPQPGDLAPVNNDRAGWPLACLATAGLLRAKPLDTVSGETLLLWWRVGVALELAGVMRAAFEMTRSYVTERIQFGRPIGSFQTIQQRLAGLASKVEASRWLALEAAFTGAVVDAAAAMGFASRTAELLFREAQQMHGATGFTREYPLHVLTMRLQGMMRECGGMLAHHRAVARAAYD